MNPRGAVDRRGRARSLRPTANRAVIVGRRGGNRPHVHALAHAVNAALGNAQRGSIRVLPAREIPTRPAVGESLDALLEAMRERLGRHPLHPRRQPRATTRPGFAAEALANVETQRSGPAELARRRDQRRGRSWFLPLDARARVLGRSQEHRARASSPMQQPLIAPMLRRSLARSRCSPRLAGIERAGSGSPRWCASTLAEDASGQPSGRNFDRL